MRNLIQIFLAAVLLSALAGCGQKGDLYVPDDPNRTAKEKLEGYYTRY